MPSRQRHRPRHRSGATGRRRVSSFHTALDDTISRYGPVQIPAHWLWTAAGLALIPLVWALLVTLGSALTTLTVEQSFWRSEPFWFFHIGVVAWLVVFVAVRSPALVWLYVFGHEWTHAIFTVLSGGKVLRGPYISASGGQVVTDRTNVFISLSPYFFPFYSALVALGFLVLRLFVPIDAVVSRTFFIVFGASWAFHATFTVWMILQSQPDLEHRGRFFSLLFIVLVNLLILALLLILAAPDLSWKLFATELSANIAAFFRQLAGLIREMAGRWDLLQG